MRRALPGGRKGRRADLERIRFANVEACGPHGPEQPVGLLRTAAEAQCAGEAPGGREEPLAFEQNREQLGHVADLGERDLRILRVGSKPPRADPAQRLGERPQLKPAHLGPCLRDPGLVRVHEEGGVVR